MQVAQLIQAQAGGIKDGAGKAGFWMSQGIQEACDLCAVRDKRQIGLKPAEWDLGRFPWLVKDIKPKKL